ncbi:MAG: hypothetical protein IJZ70_06925 [Bacteroidales bacterium]|nr:hypothetical protein [Bacteroidales bacterium]MBQ8812027.1 hypothetical protein [Bacteroidales bacterium]
MRPNISKLYHAGFKVYRVAEDNSIYRLTKHPVTRLSAAYRFDWTLVSTFRSKAGVKREMYKLLKDPMSIAIDYNDRNRNDKLVAAGFRILRCEEHSGKIKIWCSNQAWKILEKFDDPNEAINRMEELLIDSKTVEG